jgi:hypothetical protein
LLGLMLNVDLHAMGWVSLTLLAGTPALPERSRIVGELAAVSETDALPGDTLRHLALLNGAAGAIAEEIEAHTPKIGHGGES